MKKEDERKEAVVLKYDEAANIAPVVKAKGRGKIAENIIREAAKHNIPIHEDAALVELLGKININETIPEELYKAVAEVLAFIYQVDRVRERGK
ncbi:EscU/YscU/HrcU family type III secretion system export apparatus switch protein [Caldifermentibacillus hisashii]|uniref:EscU/YscU/HrcU family type III secretion system export apparatus switch protein n=1 Tax=Caldifermentibacillus hisashii TaxID=996558 RepID=UPI0034120261